MTREELNRLVEVSKLVIAGKSRSYVQAARVLAEGVLAIQDSVDTSCPPTCPLHNIAASPEE